MMTATKIKPCLWFERDAEEAVDYYLSIFPNSRRLATTRYGKSGPGPEGSVLTITFELDGQAFMALNGGPHDTFNDSVSLIVDCDTQDEIDAYWAKLTAGGGRPVQCGWLKDKFGLSWQIVPSMLDSLMSNANAEQNERLMRAIHGMAKLDIAALQAAYDGTAA